MGLFVSIKLQPNTAQQGELNWPPTLPSTGHITMVLPRKHAGIRLKKASSEVCMPFHFLKVSLHNLKEICKELALYVLY